MLYIVSTPIGNLEDITYRAVRVLNEVDLIVAEDTRHVRKLLDKYEIKTRVDSYHSHSDKRKLDKILYLLKEGKNVALVSDAGTPCISDPGFLLVSGAIDNEIQVSPIPGPSAFISALVCSGLPVSKFVFLGFLPLKKGRQTLFKNLLLEDKPVVFYESPHRIIKTLKDIEQYFGCDRKIIIGRELTKIFEEFLRATVGELRKHFEKKIPKGEFVVILETKS